MQKLKKIHVARFEENIDQVFRLLEAKEMSVVIYNEHGPLGIVSPYPKTDESTETPEPPVMVRHRSVTEQVYEAEEARVERHEEPLKRPSIFADAEIEPANDDNTAAAASRLKPGRISKPHSYNSRRPLRAQGGKWMSMSERLKGASLWSKIAANFSFIALLKG